VTSSRHPPNLSQFDRNYCNSVMCSSDQYFCVCYRLLLSAAAMVSIVFVVFFSVRTITHEALH